MRIHGLVEASLSLWGWALRPHICSRHTQYLSSLFVGCEQGCRTLSSLSSTTSAYTPPYFTVLMMTKLLKLQATPLNVSFIKFAMVMVSFYTNRNTKPKSLISLTDSVFSNHLSMSNNCQHILHTNLTTEERQWNLKEASEAVTGTASMDDDQKVGTIDYALSKWRPQHRGTKVHIRYLLEAGILIPWQSVWNTP